MKYHKILLLALLLSLTASAAIELSISTDRPQAVYTTGETVLFQIHLTQDDRPLEDVTLKGELSSNGFRDSTPIDITIDEGQAHVKGTLNKPGLLWLRVTCASEAGGPIQQVMGAAFSPEQLKPSLPKPDDFDVFWEQQKQRLDAIPANAQLKRVQWPASKRELHTITLDNINNTTIYGYLAKPAGNGPFPAYLQVQWAGVYSVDPNWIWWPAELGYVALIINAHAIENDHAQGYYDQLNQGPLKDYYYQGRDSRETSYFLRMYLSCYRAAEYLAERPEWDHKHFVVSGTSQGGGQAFVTAGLSPHVTALAANVPALCDLTGATVGRYAGWPRMVILDKQGKPNAQQLEVARYFDAVNFARSIQVPAIVGTGFMDLVCPSSSVYTAFNILQGPKEITLDPQAGHQGPNPQWQKMYDAFLRGKGALARGKN